MRNIKLFSLVLITVFFLAFMPASCAGNKYILHPGSANTADSMAYDSLRDAQAVIDTAKIQLASGALTANVKPLLNALVDAYNIAHPAWQTYHDAALAGKAVDVTTLNADLAKLSSALTAFRKGN